MKQIINYIKSLFRAAPAPVVLPIAPAAVPTKEEANRKLFDDSLTFWNSQRPNDKPAPMRETYNAKNGAIYYEYADISDLPVVRNQMLQVAMIKLQFGITEEYMKQVLIPRAKEATAKGDKDTALVILADFIDRYQLAPEQETLIGICALLLIRHDENPYSYNPIIHAQKMRHAQSDYDLQAFFLSACWLLMQQKDKGLLELWRIGSEAGFLDYLEGKIPTRKN